MYKLKTGNVRSLYWKCVLGLYVWVNGVCINCGRVK